MPARSLPVGARSERTEGATAGVLAHDASTSRQARPGTIRETIDLAKRPSRLINTTELLFVRRPAIRFLTRAAHQHRAVTFAQSLGFEERLNGVFIIDDRKRARPVRAPQAALQAPRIKYFRERVPDVIVGVGLF